MADAPSNRQWRGSPLEMERGMDPYGIKEIVLEFDTGEEEIMRPKLREEFGAYELHEVAHYLRAGVKRGIRVARGKRGKSRRAARHRTNNGNGE